MKAAAVALVALALTGCGSSGDVTDPRLTEDPAALLARAARTVREHATFSFSAAYTRTRADRPGAETYAEADGAIDLASGRGRMTIDLDVGVPTLDEPIRLRWDASALKVRVGGETHRRSRSEARVNGGLIGRLPDEPEALIALIETGRDGRVVGDEEVGGERTTHVAFLAPTKAGVPAEIPPGVDGLVGPRMPAEAWIDSDGRPRRLSVTIRFPATKTLPIRTLVVVYELAAFGEPYRG